MATLRALRTMRDRRMGRIPLYEEIVPSSTWTDEPDAQRLVIDLPEFKKEEVSLEIDDSGNVTIKGTHDVGNNRFKRFTKTVKSPENTDFFRIAGDLNDPLYTVVFPRMVEKVAKEAKGVENDEGKATGEDFMEETKPEPYQLGARSDEGQETMQQTEAVLKMIEQGAAESSAEAVKETTGTGQEKYETLAETTEKELETATMVAESMAKTTTTVTAKTEINSTQENNTTKAIQETETLEKKTTTETVNAATLMTENILKPAEPALSVLDGSAESAALKVAENVTTTSAPETDTSSKMTKEGETAAQAAATRTLLEAFAKAKPEVMKDEPQEHEEPQNRAGLMQSVMEMIAEHKTCILSSILAFSIGILISRKFNS